jgi:hypothetical protein
VRAYAWVLHTLQGDLWAFLVYFFFFSGSLAFIFLPFWGGVLYEAFLLYFVTLFISSFFSPFLILDGSRMEGLGMAVG